MKSVKIKVKDLQEFAKRSKGIKSNGIIPVLSFILVKPTETGYALIKSNVNSFCIHNVDEQQVKEPFLLDERLLNGLLSGTEAEEVEVSVKAGKVTLICGNRNISFATEPVEDFTDPSPSADPAPQTVVLSKKVLQALGIASHFTKPINEGIQGLTYVHSYGKFIASATGAIIYLKSFPDQVLPDLVLLPEVAKMLSSFENAVYFTLGNFDYFEAGNTMYGFIKNELHKGRPAFEKVVPQYQKEKFFELQAEALSSACSLAVMAASGTNADYAPGRIYAAGEGLAFESRLDEYERTVQDILPISGEGDIKDFKFNCKTVGDLLNVLPYSTLRFSDTQLPTAYNITTPEDEDFVGTINGFE